MEYLIKGYRLLEDSDGLIHWTEEEVGYYKEEDILNIFNIGMKSGYNTMSIIDDNGDIVYIKRWLRERRLIK